MKLYAVKKGKLFALRSGGWGDLSSYARLHNVRSEAERACPEEAEVVAVSVDISQQVTDEDE